jgi:hypothetical protein
MCIDTAWTKRPVNKEHRHALWRVLRLKLTRYERSPGENYDILKDLAMVEETYSKYKAMDHLFWIRLSDFLDIVPRYQHLAGMALPCGPLALISFDKQPNGIPQPPVPTTPTPTTGHPWPITNGQLTNGYH